MRFEISERVLTRRSANELLEALQEQFRKSARRVDVEGQRFKATSIEASFGSVNRRDETVVYVKPIEGGHLLVADVSYRPSMAFWIILLLTIFTWVGWLIPIFFYMSQKKTVAAAVRNCFERVKNEYTQQGADAPATVLAPSVEDALEQLGRLHEKGLITPEEFVARKQVVLAGLTGTAKPTSLAQQADGTYQAVEPATERADAGATPSFTKAWGAMDHDLPPGIKGWSWGGFFLNFIWAISNKTWIGLLTLVPVIGLPMPFILGLKGREWAWRNKQWDSVEHFVKVQRQWAIAGVIFYLVALSIVFAGAAYPLIKAKFSPPDAAGDMTVEEYSRNAATQAASQAQTSLPNARQEQEGEGEGQPSNMPAAQAVTPNKIFEKGLDFSFRADTVAGTISMVEDEEKNHFIALNGKQLFNGDDARWQYPVKLFTISKGEQVLLVASSGGRGTSCETLFFFLILYQSGALQWTPEFGTCVHDGTYVQDQGRIELTIPKMGGFSHFTYLDGRLTSEGKPVENEPGGGDDPTK